MENKSVQNENDLEMLSSLWKKNTKSFEIHNDYRMYESIYLYFQIVQEIILDSKWFSALKKHYQNDRKQPPEKIKVDLK